MLLAFRFCCIIKQYSLMGNQLCCGQTYRCITYDLAPDIKNSVYQLSFDLQMKRPQTIQMTQQQPLEINLIQLVIEPLTSIIEPYDVANEQPVHQIEIKPQYTNVNNNAAIHLSNTPRNLEVNPRSININQTEPCQIFLTVDKQWVDNMKDEGISLQINKTYISQQDSYKITRQNNQTNNRKLQLLFSQHIPIFGRYFFQATLHQYKPSLGCIFIVGVVDYMQASKRQFSDDLTDFQQSIRFQMLQTNKTDGKAAQDFINCEITYRVEICREGSQPQIKFYTNNICQKYKLKTKLASGQVAIAPYIQTRYDGTVFSWKQQPQYNEQAYRIETIQEESIQVESILITE